MRVVILEYSQKREGNAAINLKKFKTLVFILMASEYIQFAYTIILLLLLVGSV